MTPFLAIPSSTGHEAGLVPADSLAQRQALRLGWLFLLSNTCVLVLSSLPVLAELPDFYRTWFGLTDVIRILEPIVALPFQILILAETGIFQYDTDARLRKNSMALIIFFSVSAALYQQGAGLHSGSAMHKDVLETLKDDAGAVENYPILQQMYEYIRDTWQHLVSHYIYASGGILLAGLYAVLFRSLINPNGISDRRTLCVWGTASVLYGLVIAAVAIQYPFGYFVAFPLIIVWGFAFVGFLLYKSDPHSFKGFKTIGYSIVLQYYILAYLIALIVIIGWVSVNGFASRNQPK